jgi:tRNA dimethylallyltransferase
MMDLLCIVGPTAVGKTRLSLALSKRFDGEIISGDAMQFYRGLDIGTAKATQDEQKQVKHHLLDILEPNESYSVSEYQTLVRQTIKEIQSRGHLPILVGGSGLFIQSVIENYQFKGEKRKEDDGLEAFSLTELQNKLKEKNPLLFQSIDIKNKRRVIRALQKKDSDIQKKRELYYDDVCIIGLNSDRQSLYERINQRVYQMIDQGLIEEVHSLYDQEVKGQSIKAIGYKELYAHFDGKLSLEQAIKDIQKHSRHYAKRQLTWFRNKMDVTWFEVNLNDFNQTIQEVQAYIKKTHKV